MTATLAKTFPAYREPLQNLVEEHLEDKNDPLLLALYYAPQRNPEDVFLLEVSQNFSNGRLDPDRELFEMAFSNKTGFPVEDGQWVHLVLANPNEVQVAFKEHWLLSDEIRTAIRNNNAEVIYSVPGVGDELLREIRG